MIAAWLSCAWCSCHAACLDEGGAPQCERCARLAAGRPLNVGERWTGLLALLNAAGLKAPVVKTRNDMLDVLDRVTMIGLYRACGDTRSKPGPKAPSKSAPRHTYGGQSKTIAEWAAVRGLDPRLIRDRMAKGWSFADAITPIRTGAEMAANIHNRKLTPELRQRIGEMLAQGMSRNRVSVALGLNRSYVGKLLRMERVASCPAST